MIYIYKKDELIDTLNYDINEFKKEWYPNFQKDMKVYDRKFEYPIFENEELREMSKEEKEKLTKFVDGLLEQLDEER